MGKADIINFLGRMRGYRTYLEICSPTSGLRYAEVDRSKYRTCHRLMYRCPPDHDDGMGIDFRSADLDIGDCVKQIRAGDVRYDVILLDPFHEYETSVRDLKLAIELIGDGGTIIVHDCDPRIEATACPRFIQMEWSGVTYKGYLDVLIDRDDLDYCTVGTDLGCGVIRKRRSDIPRSSSREREILIEAWRRLGDDFAAAFEFLQANKVSLLKLVSVEEFLRSECQAPASG